MFTSLKHWWAEIQKLSIPVLLCVSLFAVASWIDINGIWVELPLMVNVLPERWDLPSYIVIIIQAANAGPLAYTILRKLFPDKVREWFVVVLIICIGVTSCVLLGFFWDYTTGSDKLTGEGGTSTALFSLATFLAVVDCTSSVVFLPYMATFREQYLNALFFGEGLSGLIPAILGLIQGVGGDPVCIYSNQTLDSNETQNTYPTAIYPEPRFSVDTFYFILTGLLVMSLIAFLFVHFHPEGKRERAFRMQSTNSVSSSNETVSSTTNESQSELNFTDDNIIKNFYSTQTADSTNPHSSAETPSSVPATKIVSGTTNSNEFHYVSNYNSNDLNQVQLISIQRFDEDHIIQNHSNVKAHETKERTEPLLRVELIMILIVVAWINALSNGVLPSVQTYSCLPYGNKIYNLTNRLSVAANPIACLFGIFITAKSVWIFLVLTFLGSLCSAYHLVLASLSPSPPLQGHVAGGALAITTFVVLTALFSYTKMCCAARLAEKSGAEGLLWCGVVTQLGSCIGAIIIFILINVVKVFKSTYAC